MTTPRRRKGDLAPNPRLWAALREGEGLLEVLTDFYSRVYRDERLLPFFRGVTMESVIWKQYSFLRDLFTGSRLYFGDRPRNAHHWMVISDELFDYREALMEDCLRRYGLAEDLIREWRTAEEVFRKQIVKERPIPRRVRGVDLPLEGYASAVLTSGGLCDDCQSEIRVGARATYHVRTGRTYCETCSPELAPAAGEAG